MTAKLTLSDLRNGIEEIYREVMREEGNGEASNAAVLARIRLKKGAEITQLDVQLVDIALVKLLNEVSSRKGKRSDGAATLDLFNDYRGIPKRVSLLRGRKKSTYELTISQADLWLKAHTERSDEDRHGTFRRMVEDCRPYQQRDTDSLAIMMERRRAAEQLRVV